MCLGGIMRGVVLRMFQVTPKEGSKRKVWRVVVRWPAGNESTHDARQLQRAGRGRPPVEKPAVKALRVATEVYDLIVDHADSHKPPISLADAARELIVAGNKALADD